ncbi:MAG TPA: sulfotransferase domain-containing protein [Actinomycetota bacterium]|nr:sulfotransferase domain-containing protein [Actinomycetota bacterium]
MSGLARTVTENELLRKIAFPTYRAYARAMIFYPGPRVLATSMPKAGTHLLSSLLKNFPKLMFSGRHYALRNFRIESSQSSEDAPVAFDWGRVERMLGSVNKGQFLTAHFPPHPQLVAILDKLDFKVVNILRDPRDVVVSSAHYLAQLERHFLYDRMKNDFPTAEARITAVITGLPPDEQGRGLPSVSQRIARYRQWLVREDTYTCRFERLVGARGDGSDEDQLNEIEAIGHHIGRPLTSEAATSLAQRTWSVKSSTFRKGVIGDWRNHFTEQHKSIFKELAGPQLIELGYERDLDW